MAEVFTRLKAFDAPQKDIFGHAKPIEIYHDDEGIQHAYELVHFYKFHVQAIEELIHRHEDLERRYKESENSRNALATKLHNTEIDLKGVKATLEESKENLRKEKNAHEKTKADLREAKEDLKKEIVSHQKTNVALEKSKEELRKEQFSHQKTKEMLEESKDELKREKYLHQTTKDKLKTSEEQLKATTSQLQQTIDKLEHAIIELRQTNTELTKVKGELEKDKDLLAKAQSDLARTRNELCKARENYVSADKRAEDNRRQLDEAIRNEKAANIRARDANDRADNLEEERDMLNKEVDNLKKALEKANASSNESCTGLHVIRKPNHTCGNVYIDEIIYGGKAFDDKKTVDTFLQLLKNKTVFEVHNRLFPEDPWHLNLKTLTVAYSVDGKPFQYLIGKEWEQVRFTY